MSDSILKFANKLEIRYSFNNKSNYMDAMTKHRCEKERSYADTFLGGYAGREADGLQRALR